MTEQTEQRSFKSGAALAIFNNNYLLGLGLIIILLAGASAFVNVPRIEDPRIVPRYPQITTLLPGASAARVEALVTDPIEYARREIPEIRKIDSQSIANISIINVELQPYVGAPENEQVFSEIQNQIKDVSARLPREASQ
ncbi:MAG: efflux RND transporter permease subunit, partial [Pseudomonadota bacterium]